VQASGAVDDAASPVTAAVETTLPAVVAQTTKAAPTDLADATNKTTKPVLDTATRAAAQVAEPVARAVSDTTTSATSLVAGARERAASDAQSVPAATVTPASTPPVVSFDSNTNASIPPRTSADEQATRRTPHVFGERRERSLDLPSIPSAPAAGPETTPAGGDVTMPPSHRRSPLPGLSGGPLTAFLSAFASAGAGALVILLAALAAAPFLAAPGLGRRLRLRLASWPRSILQLSLERPG
jgi:hypothetical protein